MRTDPPPESVDLAIIGGGMIGCAIACQAWHSSVLRNRMIILDPRAYLVQKLFETMQENGQRVMRSPYEHQIAPDGDIQMLDFARLYSYLLSPTEQEQITIALSGQRSIVPIDIFMAHTTHTIGTHGLRNFAYQFAVKTLRREDRHGERYWVILGNDESIIRAKTVILATGSKKEQLSQPLHQAQQVYGDRVYQRVPQINRGERILVVGSGLTSGHAITKIIEAGAHPLWALRYEERYQCADIDTAYFRTEGIAHFQHLSLADKVSLLVQENRGSLMLEFLPLLSNLEEEGRLEVYRFAVIEHITEDTRRQLCVHFSSGATVTVDKIILATGWIPDTALLPNSDVTLLDKKYPLLEETLEVRGLENFFVVGALASLVLGPAAKNIDGARLASELILPVLEERLSGKAANSNHGSYNRISGNTAIYVPQRKTI